MEPSTPSGSGEVAVFPLPQGIIVERDVPVRMRDGITISTSVFRPDRPGRFPVIMAFTAYDKDAGPNEYTTLPALRALGLCIGWFRISEATTWEGPDPGFWVPNGYVVVAVDVRGYFKSEGQPAVFSNDDVEDFAELVEWAGTREWSNGSVGLSGVSYLAIMQWNSVSRKQPPHLKAIMPWEGLSDPFREVLFHGGIPETRFIQVWIERSMSRGAGDELKTANLELVEALHANPALAEGFRENAPKLENISVPALVCASWSDQGLHTRGSCQGFRRISSPQKWLYTHGRNKWEVYYSDDALQYQKRFFDHFLRGSDNEFPETARVRLEIRKTRDEFDVRAEEEWPIARTRYTKLYLDAEKGRLQRVRPLEEAALSYDSEADDAARFELAFDTDTELSGYMKLKLWVAAESADDLDLFVAVEKLDRDGREVHFWGWGGDPNGIVASGWLRVSQRETDPERSTPWQPYLKHERALEVLPGEIVPVEIEILPSSTLFRAGEMLRLIIKGQDIVSNPRFGHDLRRNAGRHVIHTGDRYDSHLLVPIIPARERSGS